MSDLAVSTMPADDCAPFSERTSSAVGTVMTKFWVLFIQCSADIAWLIFAKSSQRAPHSSPVRVSYGVSLWIQTLIYILFEPLQWYTQYNAILDCVITAPDTIWEQHLLIVTFFSLVTHISTLAALVQRMACHQFSAKPLSKPLIIFS